MKANVNMYFKNYKEGQTKSGKDWKMLTAMDEGFNTFNMFGEKAEIFKNKKVGDKIEVAIEIVPSFNSITKKNEYVIRLI